MTAKTTRRLIEMDTEIKLNKIKSEITTLEHVTCT